MPAFLYIFGYQDPVERALCETEGFDSESSEALFIEAGSEQEALAWGCKVAQEFIRRLYGTEGMVWRAEDYAHWIESEPERRYTPGTLACLQTVRVGDYPEIDFHRKKLAQRAPDPL